MVWQRNDGHLPEACIVRDEDGDVTGYRACHVRLFGGFDTAKRGDAPWPAAGARVPTNWRISRRPHPFEIMEYELA